MKIDFPDGRKYIGKVDLSGKPNGEGTMEYPKGAVYFGNFKDGKFHGYGKFTIMGTETTEGEWLDGILKK